ncbi:hypothetical protein [Janthinobacterium lividum]
MSQLQTMQDEDRKARGSLAGRYSGAADSLHVCMAPVAGILELLAACARRRQLRHRFTPAAAIATGSVSVHAIREITPAGLQPFRA